MTPDSKQSDHPVAIWWRRWSGAVALGIVVIVGVVGFIKVESTSNEATDIANQNAVNAEALYEVVQRIDTESHEREVEFCGLVLGTFEDRVHRLGSTKEYLHSEAGREPTALNLYIRGISLPQTEVEVEKEREGIPDLCWKYKSA
jgi:hypothetical protein